MEKGLGLKTTVIALLLSLLVSFLLYANTIKGDFVYDDSLILGQKELRQPFSFAKIWTNPSFSDDISIGVYRPLSLFSFALNFVIFGNSPVSFHIVNIILNGLMIFLVFLMIFSIFKDKVLAIFSSLLFAFLPIHTEAVAFIKARDDILSATLLLLSWLIFIKAIKDVPTLNYKLITVSSLVFLLAVLAKEFAIIAPVLFLAVFWIQNRPSVKKLFFSGLIFFINSIIYLGLRYYVLKEYAFGRNVLAFITNPLGFSSLAERFFTAFKIVFVYISKVFLPYNLSATYHYNHLSTVTNFFNSWQAILGLAFISVLIFLALSKKYRSTPLGIGAMIFFVPYFMFSKFLFNAGELVSERWVYLPSLGLIIIAAYIFTKIYQYKKFLAIILLTLILVAFSFVIVNRNRIWLSREALAKSMIEDAPNSVRGHLMLASWAYGNNDIQTAKIETRAAYDIYKNDAMIITFLGRLAAAEEKFSIAENIFLTAIKTMPSYAPAHVLYALTLTKEKRYQESIEHVQSNFLKYPQNRDYRFVMAINYYHLGEINKARIFFDAIPGTTELEKIKFLSSNWPIDFFIKKFDDNF